MTETMTKAQARTRTALATFINEGHPVALAVEPLRQATIDKTEELARAKIARVAAELAEAGRDLNKCAPYPRSVGISRSDYVSAVNKYHLYSSLTVCDRCTHTPGQERLATMSDKGCARYIEQAKKEAAFQFDAFVVKMVAKVGPVSLAALQVDAGVWGRSVLTVATPSGETVHWLTQQIINYSKLGLPYNQWPSRRIK